MIHNQHIHLEQFPSGRASEKITKGCLVLQGGGWKGFYTLGVINCLMQNDINLSAVVGCSAGAMAAIGYMSGQIGWGARVNLMHRHDPNYCGIGPLIRDGGVTGFSYYFKNMLKEMPVDKKRLNDPSRRMIVSATNILTGKIKYFEKGNCILSKAIRASASLPYVSRPVMINGVPYLDGGCAEKIPFGWAERSGEEKKIVVLTNELSFRRKPGVSKMAGMIYRNYPHLLESMEAANTQFNMTVDSLEENAANGEVFIIAPSKPVTVPLLEGDLNKLAELYFLGCSDAETKLGDLQRYLNDKP